MGPLVLLNLSGAALLVEYLQHYLEIAHLAREQLVESHEQFLAGEWNLLALKSVGCLLVPTQPLLTVCSPPVIYSAIFFGTYTA